MKKLTVFTLVMILFTIITQAQTVQLKVVNNTTCDIQFNIQGGDPLDGLCPGNYTSEMYTVSGGGIVYIADGLQVTWVCCIKDTPEIRGIIFYPTSDPACFASYALGGCSPLLASVGPVAIYPVNDCSGGACNNAVTATWVLEDGVATVTFQ